MTKSKVYRIIVSGDEIMPRYARTMSKSQVYHVILRGNNKGWIFIDDEDKYRILGTLKEKKQIRDFTFMLIA